MDNIDKRMKRFGIILLVLIVGWWIYLFTTQDSGQTQASDNISKPEIITSDNPNAPQIKFPEKARSDNEEVNDFVIGLANDLLSDDFKKCKIIAQK